MLPESCAACKRGQLKRLVREQPAKMGADGGLSISLEPVQVTPEAVKRMAANLGIALDDTASLHLLSVAKLLLTLDLPTGYKHAVDNNSGQSLYIDKRYVSVWCW